MYFFPYIKNIIFLITYFDFLIIYTYFNIVKMEHKVPCYQYNDHICNPREGLLHLYI